MKKEKCPVCGKMAIIRRYPKEKFDMAVHRTFDQLGFTNVVDKCYIDKDGNEYKPA